MTPQTKSKLTKKIREQRVAIAKDVLKQLDAQRIQLERRRYLSGVLLNYDASSRGTDLQAYVDGLLNCRVCLLGACLLSKARLFNAVPVELVASFPTFGRDKGPLGLAIAGEDIHENLSSIFDSRTLTLMESAFECRDMADSEDDYSDDPEIQAAIDFGNAREPETCVRDVMQNIIDNNGEFKLPVQSPTT